MYVNVSTNPEDFLAMETWNVVVSGLYSVCSLHSDLLIHISPAVTG